jgi:hypothetical protein
LALAKPVERNPFQQRALVGLVRPVGDDEVGAVMVAGFEDGTGMATNGSNGFNKDLMAGALRQQRACGG